jgi:dTDP-4-amino-4,6-dideoxygalactose transaminase
MSMRSSKTKADGSTSTHIVDVPFFDLTRSHEGLKAALLADVSDLIDSGAFTNGVQVEAFEQAFAAYCGTDHCVGVASGLDALRLALIAAGLEPGDEVIVPAQTFVATYEAVTQAGGVPVAVDISAIDYNLDVGAVDAAITARTRFVIPVHLYGQMADMRALVELVEGRGPRIVEDACQAHGAERDGLQAGSVGLAGAFSFYPSKNLGAMGDAGALVTDDDALARHIRALREHGQTAKYRHEYEGYTSRLDTVQALMLLHKLPLLDEWNAQRRAAAAFYLNALDGVGDLALPPVPAGSEPVWHLVVVRTGDPRRLSDFLAERGVGTARHYPEPPYSSVSYTQHEPGAFPEADSLANEGLSLPIFPGISEQQLEAVCGAIGAYFNG